MNSRVNLLEKSECRYQGRVSLRMAAVVLLLVVTGITIVSFLAVSSVRLSLNAKLKNSERDWNQISAESSSLRTLDSAGRANKKTHLLLMNSLDGEHIRRYTLLEEIQKEFSDQINLNYLFAGEEVGFDSKSYSVVRLAGYAAGQDGGLLPVQLKRNLSNVSEIGALGGDMVLKELRPDKGSQWFFLLEARREMEGTR